MNLPRSERFQSQKGQAALFATMSLVVIMGLLGLVVDVGWASWRKEACKAAADSAAIAGARVAENAGNQTCGSGVVCQANGACPATLSNNSDTVQVACMYARQNGFTNGANGGRQGVLIAANITSMPVAGIAAPSYWITATVSETLPLTFLSVLGQQSVTVRASSTAAVIAGSGGCIYTLNPTAVDISMNGVTSIQTGCGIYDNSNSGSAISIVGANGQITATGGSRVNVVGNVSTHDPSQISPAPLTGAASITDPFSSMPAPTAGSCINYSGQSSISAGTYCNQITLNNGSLTFSPGVYILQNGIDIGGNATIGNTTTGGDGSGGVLFYITGGTVNFHGTPVATLNAPTSGTYRGMLFWQDRSDTNDATLKGGSSLTANGVLYFPKAALTYNGGTNTTNTTIVSDTLRLVGTSYIHSGVWTPYSGTVAPGSYLVQ